MDSKTPKPNAVDGEVQGEGDYRSARKFVDEERKFATDDAKVRAAGKSAAEALDGPEGEELERARKQAAKGDPVGTK